VVLVEGKVARDPLVSIPFAVQLKSSGKQLTREIKLKLKIDGRS